MDLLYYHGPYSEVATAHLMGAKRLFYLSVML